MMDLEKEIPGEDEEGFLTRSKDMDEESAEEAYKIVKSILRMAESVPEKAEEFAAGVSETAVSIQSRIEKMGKATPKMISALTNMESGLSRWTKDD